MLKKARAPQNPVPMVLEEYMGRNIMEIDLPNIAKCGILEDYLIFSRFVSSDYNSYFHYERRISSKNLGKTRQKDTYVMWLERYTNLSGNISILKYYLCLGYPLK